MMPIIPSFLLLSQDRPMQIKSRDWLIVKFVLEEEKDSIGQNKVEMKSLSLLMILTCLKKKSLEHNLLFNFLDSGWTTEDGMISKAKSLSIYVE